MSETLRHPSYWLVYGTDWPANDAVEYAESAIAIAPSFIPAGMLSVAGTNVRDLVQAIAREERRNVLFFSEVTQFIGQLGHSWEAMGVADWGETLEELSRLTPSLILTLSQYAHVMVCGAGIGTAHVYTATAPEGEQIPATEFENLRSGLESRLRQDWPAYIDDLERRGKIRTID